MTGTAQRDRTGLTCRSCAYSFARPSSRRPLLMCSKPNERPANRRCPFFTYEPGTDEHEHERHPDR